jgi:hypothetical protein
MDEVLWNILEQSLMQVRSMESGSLMAADWDIDEGILAHNLVRFPVPTSFPGLVSDRPLRMVFVPGSIVDHLGAHRYIMGIPLGPRNAISSPRAL